MKVKCQSCGLPINVAGADNEDPHFCNHCYAHTEGEAPEKFGCKYLGNNAWDCGYIEQEVSGPDNAPEWDEIGK